MILCVCVQPQRVLWGENKIEVAANPHLSCTSESEITVADRINAALPLIAL